MPLRSLTLLTAAALMLSACSREQSHELTGFMSTDFVFIAAEDPGILEHLYVDRGQLLAAGDKIFDLETTFEEHHAERIAQEKIAAESQLSDAQQTSLRDQELAKLDAQKQRILEEIELAESRLERHQQLHTQGHISEDRLDELETERDTWLAELQVVEAEINIGYLSERDGVIQANQATVAAKEAELQQVLWEIDSKTVVATEASQVYDIFYRPGEFVPQARPVVSLFVPEYLKAVFYIPETLLNKINLNHALTVTCTSCDEDYDAVVSFISPEYEFSPPTLFDTDNRDKLLFRVEATFAQPGEIPIKPGQPIEAVLRVK